MIIGYVLIGKDNDSFMFDPDDKNLPICKACGYVIDYDYVSPSFEVNIKKYDMSYTYDGRCIVSQKFKDFCQKNNYSGIEFSSLPNNNSFFQLVVNNIVEVDKERKKYEYDKYCSECNKYESITPGFPVILKDDVNPLKDGFYATDFLAGSCNGKTRLNIVAPETEKKLKKAKMKGLIFIKVEG